MYRHLLVPVDGSTASRHVAEHAYELADQLGARVTVLHVLEEVGVPLVQYGMEPYVDIEAVSVDVIEAHREAGQRLVDDVVATAPPQLQVEGRSVEAQGRRVAEVVTETAEEVGAELIVMGTHGHRGLSRVFLGSVADGVVRSSDVPVTLVRHHEHDEDRTDTGSGGHAGDR